MVLKGKVQYCYTGAKFVVEKLSFFICTALQCEAEILTDYEQSGGHNTVRNLEGYKYYSGFNISANKNGCFPFQDKSGNIQYFDLSAWDLPYKPGNGDDSVQFIRGNSDHRSLYRKPLNRSF